MAEFQEVIRQFNRMRESAMTEDGFCLIDDDDMPTAALKWPDNFEKTVMRWANEHPEYPTWIQWWEMNFGNSGAKMVSPCSFASPKELGCSSLSSECGQAPYRCWHKPIPAHIAVKLGIQPLDSVKVVKSDA